MDDNAVFCEKCGSKVGSSQTQQAAADWQERTMDDFYFAAVEGRVDDVREILKHQPELMTETYTTEADDGIVVTATAVFSIIAKFKDDGINYAVLDAISAAGVNYNQTVKLDYPNSSTSTRGLIFYPVAIWDNPELAGYLLAHGADPNAVVDDNTGSVYGRYSHLPLLYYAITNCESAQMTHLLLSYGADPKICARPFVDEINNYQKLPMTVYSVVDEHSPEKTALLIHYGASPQDMVDLGKGYKRVNSVYNYVKMGYPQKTAVIDLAMMQARQMPPSPVNNVYMAMYGNQFAGANAPVQQGAPQTASSFADNRPNDKLNKKCYNKFVAYLFGNFSVLGVGFGVIGPIILASGKQPEAAVGLLAFGIPCILLAALIGFLVYMTGKKRGQSCFFGEFITDSLLMLGKVLLCMTIILIPLVIKIGSSSGEWSYRKTTDGREVYVQKTGDGEYRDAYGKNYHKKEE